jgi:hypothetical protein
MHKGLTVSVSMIQLKNRWADVNNIGLGIMPSVCHKMDSKDSIQGLLDRSG